MTWTYSVADDGSSMEIYDHNENPVKTLQNGGSGFTIPDDVFTAMRDEAETARANGDTERWRDIHIRLADDDIAERH